MKLAHTIAALLAVAAIACGGKPAPEEPRLNACHEDAGGDVQPEGGTCGEHP